MVTIGFLLTLSPEFAPGRLGGWGRWFAGIKSRVHPMSATCKANVLSLGAIVQPARVDKVVQNIYGKDKNLEREIEHHDIECTLVLKAFSNSNTHELQFHDLEKDLSEDSRSTTVKVRKTCLKKTGIS